MSQPLTISQKMAMDRAYSPYLLPDTPPCNNQLYPAGAVLQPINKPYTLRSESSLRSQRPEGSYTANLVESFGNIPKKKFMKLITILLLVQIILLILLVCKK